MLTFEQWGDDPSVWIISGEGDGCIVREPAKIFIEQIAADRDEARSTLDAVIAERDKFIDKLDDLSEALDEVIAERDEARAAQARVDELEDAIETNLPLGLCVQCHKPVVVCQLDGNGRCRQCQKGGAE